MDLINPSLGDSEFNSFSTIEVVFITFSVLLRRNGASEKIPPVGVSVSFK